MQRVHLYDIIKKNPLFRRKDMKKLICLLLILASIISVIGCTPTETPEVDGSKLNGEKLADYVIVYSADDYDYSKRAAEYIKTEILDRTGLDLSIVEDGEADEARCEIVVGNTDRQISKTANGSREGLEFCILAEGGKVALRADYFIIAAAAYFFIENYVPEDNFAANIPEELKVHTPIIKEAKNYIMLIGDGMGVYQTQIFDYMENTVDYSDGEDIFYGYYLPYMGYSRTQSLDGITDSAAGGTALACGHKTHNEYIGRDGEGNDIKSLTELAREKGKKAAVMSTENNTGATPASFSAHCDSRDSSGKIVESQMHASQELGIRINCGYDYYTVKYMGIIERKVTDMFDLIGDTEEGFFLMYEEAYIDKHCHNNNLDKAMQAITRFNQVIARVMEYAFYHPETFVLITADHETGDLYPEEDGTLAYHHDDHTAKNVPIFAYGDGAELFDGVEVENIQIAHTIASFMGEYNFGDQSEYKYLSK